MSTDPNRRAPLANEMILASAGSGKTYRLTNRFIQLLARGASPERLIALTFTRKAASEFLDEILRKLSNAALDEEVAGKLRADIGEDAFDSQFARKLLREVVDKLHLLMLGTLDSFFHRILRCFPAEFGLTSNFDVLDEAESHDARREVFERLFEDGETRTDFVEAFRLATFGVEEKQLVPRLDDFVKNYHSLYLEAPDAGRWGGEKAIWPKGCRWLRGIGDLELECEGLRRAIELMSLPDHVEKAWTVFLELMREMAFGKKWGRLKTLALPKALLENYGTLRAGGPLTLSHNRRSYQYSQEVCAYARRLIDYMMFCEVFPHVERTRGIHAVLAAFEDRYHDQVRRAGRLGFDDVQQLLAGSFQPPGSAATLSQTSSGDRLNVDYRLDGRFDHWLLDEFQDTSLRQWRVIENLIDEVVQDDSGERSFFYVGDVKQAIFGWRGGDSRLFRDIFQHYAAGGEPRIEETSMELSYRSGPALLNAVNRVFGSRPVFDRLFPAHTAFVARWFETWREHQSNYPDRSDFFQLLTIPKPDSEDEDSGEDIRFEVVTAILENLKPHQRNLSCGVLVRRNASALRLADYIRANTQIPVVVEGDTLIGSDHPIAASFLALLQFTAHPGDELAWKHLTMTPALARFADRELGGWRRRLVESTLARVHDEGFTGAFEAWLGLLVEGGFAPDKFARRRIEQLRQATREFDRRGSRNITEFMRYAKAFTTRESPASGVVQIMTIHKAKGLGFDAVIVAEIEGSREEALTELKFLSLVANRGGEGRRREIEWILSMPNKDAGKLDPVLREARLKLENERAFEELCVLYVALTRAKFANYVVCSAPSKRTVSARTLMVEALDSGAPKAEQFGKHEANIVFETGNPDWILDDRFLPEFKPAPPAAPPALSVTRRFKPATRQLPSELAEKAAATKAGGRLLFTPQSLATARHGTVVHELFETIDWLDDLPKDELARRLDEAIDLDDPEQLLARDEVISALASPEVERAFLRKMFTGTPAAWLERRFEMIHEGAWISGVFDRVVVTHSGAWVYDFKTNRVKGEADIDKACETYKPQLATYRTALSKLLGFETTRIHSYLIFTRVGRVREVR